MTPAHHSTTDFVIADLGRAVPTNGQGAVWSLPHGGDLDANLVRLDPGGTIGEHVNDDVAEADARSLLDRPECSTSASTDAGVR